MYSALDAVMASGRRSRPITLRSGEGALSRALFAVRGLAILQVLVIHTIGVHADNALRRAFPEHEWLLGPIAELIDSYNMQAMLVSSGIVAATFAMPIVHVRTFLAKRGSRLLVPLLVWAPLHYVLWTLAKHGPSGFHWIDWVTMWTEPYDYLWYLHALFFAMALDFAWARLGVGDALKLVLNVALLVGYAYVEHRFGDVLYWQLGFGLVWSVPFSAGKALIPLVRRMVRARRGTLLTLFVIFVAGVLVMFALHRVIPTAFWYRSGIVGGTFAWLACCVLAVLWLRAAYDSPWFATLFDACSYVGSLSMVVYLVHVYGISVGRWIALKLAPDSAVLAAFASFVIALWVPLWGYEQLKRHRWFLVIIGGAPTQAQRVGDGARGEVRDSLPARS